MARFRPGSRYTNGSFTLNPSNKEFLILRETIVIPETPEDVYLAVDGRHKRRVDLLSQDAYGRPDLGWVIMDINQIRQPLTELEPGLQLRIPPLEKVLEAIDKLNLGK